MARNIFLSHASADTSLVDSFVQLLESGVGVRHSQIFCSSIEGHGIPPGNDFKEYIKQALAEAELVFALISKNFYASAFCMCELGAMWIQAKHLIPVVVPPLTSNDLKAVLSGVQSLKLNDESALDTVKDAVSKLTADPTPTPLWNKRRKDFLSALPGILDALPKPEYVSAEETAGIRQERDEYKSEYDKADERIRTLERTVNELSQLKDQQKAAEIIKANSTESDRFEDLVASATNALGFLPKVVREALYYDCRGEWFRPDYEKWENAPKDAEERGFLKYRDDGNLYAIREDNPKIRKAKTALDKLQNFVVRASSSFSQAYEDKHDESLDFQSRNFWELNL